jgi:hypothetical protein
LKTYTHWDVLMASPTEPLPVEKRMFQLTRMFEGLSALERDPAPTYDDWKVVSDALNMMETLLVMGQVEDPDDLIGEAAMALAKAGNRSLKGHPIRLDASAIQLIRAILQDYCDVLDNLPARTMIQAHRQTENRVTKIIQGKSKPHDLRVSK